MVVGGDAGRLVADVVSDERATPLGKANASASGRVENFLNDAFGYDFTCSLQASLSECHKRGREPSAC